MKIEKTVKRLRLEFLLMWVLAAVLAICYELELFLPGACVGNTTSAYILETAAVLLTLAAVPVSLKISGRFLSRRLAGLPPEKAAAVWLRWSEVQVFLLTVVVLVDVSVYYSTMESLGILCAAVGLVASLLCFPSQARFESYLSNPKEK